MGGSSSSKSSTTNNTNTFTPQNYESPGSNLVTGVDGSVTITDGGAFDLAGDVIDESRSAREDALMFAGEASVAQQEAIADAIEAGYTFAGEASAEANRNTAEAIAGLKQSQEMGYQFAGESVEAGFAFAGESTQTAFDNLESSRVDTFQFLGEAFTAAMESASSSGDRVQELAKQTAGNLMENAQYSIDQVAEANESENLETMRMIVLAGVATVGFIAWSGRK